MSHIRGRYIPVLEQEVRRAVKEPVAVWKQEWVLPASSAGGVAADSAAASGSTKNDGGLKILKWVKTSATAEFPEDEDQEYAGATDLDTVAPTAITITTAAPVAVASSLTGGAAGGLGSIAPPVDLPPPAPNVANVTTADAVAAVGGVASALPLHLQSKDSAPASGDAMPAAPLNIEADASADAESGLSLRASAEFLGSLQTESRNETPQAHSQVAGELHPPPSGLPREDESAELEAAGTQEASRSASKEIGVGDKEDESALPRPKSASVEDIQARGVISIEPEAIPVDESAVDPEAEVAQEQGDGDVTMAENGATA